VGVGNIAQVAVLPALAHAKQNSTLTALVSSNPKKRTELAKRFDVEHAVPYHELDRLVSENLIDAVYIACRIASTRSGLSAPRRLAAM
jgi:predicted dehydrogenase